MRSIEALIEAVREEALRAQFPVDTAVYEKAGKDPSRPVLFAGSLDAPVCCFGRDLGKDEVAAGEPLIGAGGRLVRRELVKVFESHPDPADKTLSQALRFALLTNTVPYKPPGNKAYPDRVKERFRPLILELLVDHWKGDRVLTLGTEAFQWFAPYADSDASEFWKREDRYEAELSCTLEHPSESGKARKSIRLGPLPHPSPLNQKWYSRFPGLLEMRLRA